MPSLESMAWSQIWSRSQALLVLQLAANQLWPQ
eukprot:CAMPEP_0183355912 /NCGR_PEP_ID=MMETSP0164_2-20130417/42362_1 /TAXON_ID=221442 /ORGANISM="Coccolithus pelagicus ssp braarudi, Strain PLY182g" /LENGTH=32 /DNA_ID= /DNA_START= /DNA_END= /DNA_ORIENTATION=